MEKLLFIGSVVADVVMRVPRLRSSYCTCFLYETRHLLCVLFLCGCIFDVHCHIGIRDETAVAIEIIFILLTVCNSFFMLGGADFFCDRPENLCFCWSASC